MERQSVKDFFDRNAETYNRHAHWSRNDAILSTTMNMLRTVPGRDAVDLGAGDGRLLSLLREATRRVAVDISSSMLRSANDPHVEKVIADVQRLPFRDNCFDLAICRQVIHYTEPILLLREAHRVLRQGGHLHIAQLTDYEEVPRSWREYWISLRGIRSRTFYTDSELKGMAEEAGFRLTDEENVSLSESYSWDDFLEKNHVPHDRREEVKDFFRRTDSAIAKSYALRVTEGEIAFTRRLSLLLLVVVGD